jgi:GTP-binding protein
MKKRKVEMMTISALARTGVRELLLKAAGMLAEAPSLEEIEPPMPVYRPEADPRDFTVRREADAGWRVSGAAIERAAAMTYWEHHGSARRFQKLMEKLGVEEALRKAGIEAGDTVRIGEFELEWQE